jgi:GT2 family glycosyltransferase
MTVVQDTGSILCSVCIANYQGMALIDDCIDSVCSQAVGFNIEIIVHDDASSDGSAAYIRAKYPFVRLIESQENVGYCIANNRMAARANGRYLLLLNNDAMLLPGALDVLRNEADRIGGPAILTLPQYDALSGELLDIGSRLDLFLNAVPNRNCAITDVGMVAGACLWIDRQLWEEIGGFPEWFGSLAEDLFLCCRARLAGYPVRALARSGYLHHVGAQFGGGKMCGSKLNTTFRRRALTERNKTFVMFMAYPPLLMPMMLLSHLTLLLVEGTFLSLLKWKRTYLNEIYLPVFLGLVRFRKELRTGRSASLLNRRLSSIGFFAVFDPLPYKLRMLLKHGLPETQ